MIVRDEAICHDLPLQAPQLQIQVPLLQRDCNAVESNYRATCFATAHHISTTPQLLHTPVIIIQLPNRRSKLEYPLLHMLCCYTLLCLLDHALQNIPAIVP